MATSGKNWGEKKGRGNKNMAYYLGRH